jgi:hypothetical protein
MSIEKILDKGQCNDSVLCITRYYILQKFFYVVYNIVLILILENRTMPISDQHRPIGHPRGEPSTVVNMRLPLSLIAQLDRYLDWIETHTGKSMNRGIVMRRALQKFLERHAVDLI